MWSPRRRRAERNRQALERRCSTLVGEHLTGVTYVGYERAGYQGAGDFDSIDHGLELQTSSGRSFGLFWDEAEVDFAMNVMEGRVPADVPRVDVTESSRWSVVRSRRVSGARPIWRRIDGLGPRSTAPQSIRLDFEGGARVVVTAAELDRDPPWAVGADHVTVFFGDAWERRSDLTAEIHPTLD